MRVARKISATGSPLALAVGNFDGVHLGHQAILRATKAAARRLQLDSAALTFAPMPREFFAYRQNNPALAPPRLMSIGEKLTAFAEAGLDHVFVPRFDERFSRQSPADFLESLRAADVHWMMVGDDFRFGVKRTGDVGLMRQFGAAHGIEVETMSDVVIGGSSMRVSSSAIREALAAGRLSVAAEMLGRPYAITGRVTHGKKLGRTLGFPTANIALSGRKPALAGVFAVKCQLVTRGLEGVAGDVGETLDGVANLGTNPVVSSENRQHLEVFLFDYLGDLYGRRVQVSFIEKIRDEQNFASLDALVTQMHDDTARAKKILSRMNPDGSAG
ncbi:MAG: bifunctional riboflavin kinase/FAD synthetase [Rhodocyclaceae bacterium]|nr:bifunctional riboflavin kinase/FAD synthetase [Rhodocyclaceae bacterium]